jgi:hypothetical protein
MAYPSQSSLDLRSSGILRGGVLAVCILGTPSSFTLSVSTLSHPGSTLLAVITPTDCYPARTFQNVRYRLLAFFLSYSDS